MKSESRIYLLDNFKLLLIYLVVFGHLLELFIGFSDIKIIYLIIYSFHMPAFVFISGYLYKAKKTSIQKIFVKYIVFQLIYILFAIIVLKENFAFKEIIFKPYWIMWYLFSLGVWNIIMKILKPSSKKSYLIILAISLIISLLIGFVDKIGYDFSLSRIIVFFPYFVLGTFIRNYYDIEKIKSNSKGKVKNCKDYKSNIYSVIPFILCTISVIAIIFSSKGISSSSFYGSLPYNLSGTNIIFRLCSYIIGISFICFFIRIIPNKEYKFTIIGQKTESIYLLHGFMILVIKMYINKYFVSEQCCGVVLIILSMLTAVIIVYSIGTLQKEMDIKLRKSLNMEDKNAKE